MGSEVVVVVRQIACKKIKPGDLLKWWEVESSRDRDNQLRGIRYGHITASAREGPKHGKKAPEGVYSIQRRSIMLRGASSCAACSGGLIWV